MGVWAAYIPPTGGELPGVGVVVVWHFGRVGGSTSTLISGELRGGACLGVAGLLLLVSILAMTYRSRSGGPPKTHRKGGKNKKTPKLHHPPPQVEEDHDDPPPRVSDEEILSVLKDALRTSLESPTFRNDVQTAKGLLFERKWLELFTDRKLLDAYAGRWVPSRALCFRDLMVRLKEVRELFGEAGEAGEEEEESDEESEDEGVKETTVAEESKEGDAPDLPATSILSLGGGAGSELLAVAAMASSTPINWTGADIGDWGDVLSRLEASAKATWDPNMTFTFTQCDILEPSPLPSATLTTLFFTLAELFAQSRPKTLALLKRITSNAKPGELLLVADSASDIAQLPLGKDGRTWPIYMVLDVALVGWEVVKGEDSTWFRLGEAGPVARHWPAKLENARYWYRLYRRV